MMFFVMGLNFVGDECCMPLTQFVVSSPQVFMHLGSHGLWGWAENYRVNSHGSR